MKIKAVSYCRVSSKEQEETGYSLPSQVKLMEEYAQRKDFQMIKVFSIAESASGAKQRVVFAEMLEFLEKNKVNILLCEKVDRLTRNFKEALAINDWVEGDVSRQIHFVKQNLIIHKNAKSDEKFRWDIEIVLAKKFISNLSEEVKKGQKEKLAQGWLPTKPPLGYKTIGEKGHKTHIIDQEIAPFVKRMFELYGSGNYSMKAVIEMFYKEGFRTRSGKKMVKSVIESILNNPFCYGAMEWNDEVFSNGSHEPLITKELFEKVRDIRMGKKTPHFNRHEFQFRKMFICGECSGTITAEIQKGIVYYHCNHYRNCSQKKYAPEKELEDKLFGVFKFFETITPEEAEQIKVKIKENHAQEIEYKESAIKGLNDRYSSLQRRLDNVYDDRLDERITRERWEIKNKEIIEEQNAVIEQLGRIKTEEAKYFEIWLNIIDLARRAREIYEKRSPEDRRLLLSHIFSNLILTDKEVTPTMKTPVQKLAERVQQRLDQEKTFEQAQKTTKTLTAGGSLLKTSSQPFVELPEPRNHFRTSKKSLVKPRQRQIIPLSRPLLRR